MNHLLRPDSHGMPVPFNFLAPPNWRAIVKLQALKHGVGTRDILGVDRHKPIPQARHKAMQMIYRHCELSSPIIGRLFGGRDHTTVLYSIRRIEGRQKPRGRYAH